MAVLPRCGCPATRPVVKLIDDVEGEAERRERSKEAYIEKDLRE